MELFLTELKKGMTSKPMLYASDYSQDFIIQTDALEKGLRN